MNSEHTISIGTISVYIYIYIYHYIGKNMNSFSLNHLGYCNSITFANTTLNYSERGRNHLMVRS